MNNYTAEEKRELRRCLNNSLEALKQQNGDKMLDVYVNNVFIFSVRIKSIFIFNNNLHIGENLEMLKSNRMHDYIYAYRFECMPECYRLFIEVERN